MPPQPGLSEADLGLWCGLVASDLEERYCSAFRQWREMNRRFEREARAVSALNHPHIGAIHEFEEAARILKRQNRFEEYIKVSERLIYHAPQRENRRRRRE